MPPDSIDAQLVIFRRQYLQLLDSDFLTWPPPKLLKEAGVQKWLFKNLFNEQQNSYLPPDRYQCRVLKTLVAKIEQAVEDPEEDEISDSLMSHLSSLLASNIPSEGTAVQQRAYVTFSFPDWKDDHSEDDLRITLLEKRNLISGSKTTGFRTWEAALHLASYLITPVGREMVRGQNIIELGAGTGFLSIVCAKHLSANHVTCTDGDEAVVEAMTENFFFNELDSTDIATLSVLRWGHAIQGSWVQDDFDAWPYDIVLGADIIYDKTAVSSLVSTLIMLWELRPSIKVLMASAIRNAETYAAFLKACETQKLQVEEIQHTPKSMRESAGLFYATAMPLKILHIRPPVHGLLQ